MNDIEVYQPSAAEVAVPPANDTDSWVAIVQDIIKIANVVYDTPFVPDGLRGSAPAVAAAMLAGREMGLGIMTSLANIDIIKGKPTQKALLMRAMILSRGHKLEDVDISDVRVVVRGCRKGESTWAEASFTAEQAKRAGIDLGKYPVDKLYARATSRLARRKFADVIMGMPYSAEELEDGEVLDEAPDAPAAIDAPKPAARTARRRTPPAAPPPQPAAATTQPPAAAAAAPQGPPLPGEDDPDPTTTPAPATGSQPSGSATGDNGMATAEPASRGLIGIVVAHFKRLGFADDEREQRLTATSTIIGRDINSANDMTTGEARKVTDILARCKDRDQLTALLVAGDKPETDDNNRQDTTNP